MRWNPVQAGFRTSSCMVCGFLLPSFSLFLLQSYSFWALINTANFFSSEKHGVPERGDSDVFFRAFQEEDLFAVVKDLNDGEPKLFSDNIHQEIIYSIQSLSKRIHYLLNLCFSGNATPP